MHGPPQVLADDRVRLGDADQRTADRLAHRYAGALALVGERPGAPAEPGGAGQLGDQPVPLGAGAGRAVGIVAGLELVDLGAEALEAAAVLADRLVVEHRLDGGGVPGR